MAPLPTWFKALAWVMAALLALSAALQYNDPDPLRWIAVYGAGAVVSILLLGDRRLAAVSLAVGLAAGVWAAVLIAEVWGVIELADLPTKMSEKGGAVEVGREAGGLVIEAVWLLFASGFRRRRA